MGADGYNDGDGYKGVLAMHDDGHGGLDWTQVPGLVSASQALQPGYTSLKLRLQASQTRQPARHDWRGSGELQDSKAREPASLYNRKLEAHAACQAIQS